MKTSNLAECLEEFAATMIAVDTAREKPPRMVAVEDCDARRAPRRLSLSARRIQIRETGLPQFRVF